MKTIRKPFRFWSVAVVAALLLCAPQALADNGPSIRVQTNYANIAAQNFSWKIAGVKGNGASFVAKPALIEQVAFSAPIYVPPSSSIMGLVMLYNGEGSYQRDLSPVVLQNQTQPCLNSNVPGLRSCTSFGSGGIASVMGFEQGFAQSAYVIIGASKDLSSDMPTETSESGALHVYRKISASQFSPSKIYPSAFTSFPGCANLANHGAQFGYSIEVGDLDGDSIQDLIVSAPNEKTVLILYGTPFSGYGMSGRDYCVTGSEMGFGQRIAVVRDPRPSTTGNVLLVANPLATGSDSFVCGLQEGAGAVYAYAPSQTNYFQRWITDVKYDNLGKGGMAVHDLDGLPGLELIVASPQLNKPTGPRCNDQLQHAGGVIVFSHDGTRLPSLDIIWGERAHQYLGDKISVAQVAQSASVPPGTALLAVGDVQFESAGPGGAANEGAGRVLQFQLLPGVGAFLKDERIGEAGQGSVASGHLGAEVSYIGDFQAGTSAVSDGVPELAIGATNGTANTIGYGFTTDELEIGFLSDSVKLPEAVTTVCSGTERLSRSELRAGKDFHVTVSNLPPNWFVRAALAPCNVLGTNPPPPQLSFNPPAFGMNVIIAPLGLEFKTRNGSCQDPSGNAADFFTSAIPVIGNTLTIPNFPGGGLVGQEICIKFAAINSQHFLHYNGSTGRFEIEWEPLGYVRSTVLPAD